MSDGRINNGGKRRHHRAPALTYQDAQAAIEMHNAGHGNKAIANRFNVSVCTVSRCINKHGAYK